MASDSDHDMPFAQRTAAQRTADPPTPASESEDDLPLARRAVPANLANGNAASSNGLTNGVTTAANPNGANQPTPMEAYDSSSSDDDIPLGL